MYRGLSVIAVAPAYNEETKIGEVLRRTPRDVVDEGVFFRRPAALLEAFLLIQQHSELDGLTVSLPAATRNMLQDK